MSLRIGLLLPTLLALLPSSFEVHGGEPAPNTPDHRVIEALELWKGGNPSARHRGLRRLERLGPRAAAVPSLIPSLTDPDPTIRRETAEILEEIGEPAQAAAPALLAALGDSERDVRKMAARALGSIKPDPKAAIPALVTSIRAGRDRRCLEAISTLGTLGETAVPALIDFLGDNDPDVRRLAARALAAIGPGARAAIPTLIEAQRRPDREERQRVAEALARMGPATVQPLVLALRDRDPKVRGGAARALELQGPGAKAAVPVLIAALADPEPPDDPEPPRGPAFPGQAREGESQPSGYFAALRAIGAAAVPPLLERIDRPDERDRALAFRALGFLGGCGKAAIPRLMALLNDPARRLEAAQALGGIGPAARAAVPMLIAGLKDPDPVYRARSAETLGRIGWSLQNGQYTRWTVARRAITPLIAALDDPDARVRAAATIALRDIGPEAARAIRDVIRLLHDPAAEVRSAALAGFPRLGEVPAAERQTIGRLLRDVDPHVRLAAARLITNDDLSRETVIAGLLAALEDPDIILRAEAALKLARTSKHADISLDDRTGGRASGNNATLLMFPRAGAVLRVALADPDSRVRAGAAYALGSFQNEAAATVPLLIPRLRDPSVSVRIAAAVALGQFGKDARAAVPALMEAATDPDGIRNSGLGVWAAAAQALDVISSEASGKRIDHLFALLDNPNADARRRAARVLQHYDIEVCSRLFRLLADPKTQRRVRVELVRVILGDSWGWGVEHLEELRDLSPREAHDAIPALRDLTRDGDPEVRENARNVLNTLEGEGDDEAPDRSLLEAVREGDIACWDFDSGEDGTETSELGMLLEGLKDPDEDVRTAAAYRLSALADSLPAADDLPEGKTRDAAEEQAHAEGLKLRARAVTALIPALKDPDTQARWAAAWALRRLGPGLKDQKDVVAALTTMLKDRTSRVRRGGWFYFAFWLNDGGGSSRCGQKGNGEKVRIAAIQGLAAFRSDAAPAVPDLIDALHDEDPLTRRFAVGALEPIGPAARPAVPALIAILRSKEVLPPATGFPGISPIPGTSTAERLRLAIGAAQALEAIGPDAAAAIPELARLATAESDESIAAAAVHALGGIGEPAVPALIKLVHDGGWEIRIGALNALGRVGPKAATAIPELVRALSDPDEAIRAAAAEALDEIGTGPGGAAAIPALLVASKDPDGPVRVNAVAALGAIGPEDARVVAALAEAMKDPDQIVTYSASSSLQWIGLPALPTLLRMLRTNDKELNDRVAQTLSQIGRVDCYPRREEEDEPALVRARAARAAVFAALQDPDIRVRDGAARTLGYMGKEVVPELIAALGHTSPQVRLQAARALGFIGKEASTALDALRQRQHDPEPAVRAAAEAAIKAIHGSEP